MMSGGFVCQHNHFRAIGHDWRAESSLHFSSYRNQVDHSRSRWRPKIIGRWRDTSGSCRAKDGQGTKDLGNMPHSWNAECRVEAALRFLG
jgi:hypothetical protein